MELSVKLIVLIAGIVLTGLTAGLCFTWSNAVTPGIGRLDDLGYLQAFQQMNRVIINPTFVVVFFGPVILHIANVILFRNAPRELLILLIAAAVLYIGGLFLVTIFGNVPLNVILDKTDLVSASIEELSELRERFEARWNNLHLLRTISTTLSFIMLVVSLAFSSKMITI
jgi:uncharacterized membrane protein